MVLYWIQILGATTSNSHPSDLAEGYDYSHEGLEIIARKACIHTRPSSSGRESLLLLIYHRFHVNGLHHGGHSLSIRRWT